MIQRRKAFYVLHMIIDARLSVKMVLILSAADTLDREKDLAIGWA